VVFSQSFGRQAVSFGVVRFFWLVFFLAKSGFQNRLHFFSKVSASLVQAFSPGSFFLASLFFGKVSF
jgi:hypothetical protein